MIIGGKPIRTAGAHGAEERKRRGSTPGRIPWRVRWPHHNHVNATMKSPP